MDLDLNAHANARRWHGDRKARSAKQAKTLDANTRALKVAEKKAQAQLSKARARRHDDSLLLLLLTFPINQVQTTSFADRQDVCRSVRWRRRSTCASRSGLSASTGSSRARSAPTPGWPNLASASSALWSLCS